MQGEKPNSTTPRIDIRVLQAVKDLLYIVGNVPRVPLCREKQLTDQDILKVVETIGDEECMDTFKVVHRQAML